MLGCPDDGFAQEVLMAQMCTFCFTPAAPTECLLLPEHFEMLSDAYG